LEEEVGGVGVEGDVADFVDDDQLVAADLLQLGLQGAGLVGYCEPVDPSARGVEQDAVAVLGRPRAPSPTARWVFPIPGGPKRITFSALSTYVDVARCASRSRRRDGRWS
jgi:hypothetical protein